MVNVRKRSLLTIDKSILREGKMHLRAVVVNGHGLRVRLSPSCILYVTFYTSFQGEWITELESVDGQEAEAKLKAVFRISEIVEQGK